MKKYNQLKTISVPKPADCTVVKGETHWEMQYCGRVNRKFLKQGLHWNLQVTDDAIVYSFLESHAAMENALKTITANAIADLRDGYRVTLEAFYKHFPMTVTQQGDRIRVTNLLGYKTPLYIKLPADILFEAKGNNRYELMGWSRVTVGNFAHRLQRMPRLIKRRKLDKRVFVDSLYVVERKPC